MSEETDENLSNPEAYQNYNQYYNNLYNAPGNSSAPISILDENNSVEDISQQPP